MIDEIWQILKAALTPLEWEGAIRLALFVFAGTELLKRFWRRFGRRFVYSDVWFISAALGIAGAFYWWPGEPDSNTHWLVAGLVVSAFVSFVHRWALIGIRWKFPALAAIITGDRRKADRLPQNAIDRRKPD